MKKTEIPVTTADLKEEYKKFRGRKILFILFSIFLIFSIAGISATLGSYPITVHEVYSIIFKGLFNGPNTTEDFVIWDLRLPRILMGVLAGIGFAVAGTMTQGILKNPLASPYTLGISSGAGLGAAIAIIFTKGFFAGEYLIIGNAFIFSLIPTFIIVALTRFKMATSETMILAGIAMTYIFSALTTLLMYLAEPEAVKAAYFWTVGDLGRASWDNLLLVSVVLACCIFPLMWKSWDVNAMGAGDETAKSLGVNVERSRILILVISSFITASIVSFTGAIGFICLVAPHISRMIIGGDNRFLIPASGLFGAALLLASDAIGRTIIAPIILPVGLITSGIGGPLFLYLIMRQRREYW